MLSTLNFKTSLFEGILDNGEDTIFLEDSKFDKIMDSIKVVADSSETVADVCTDGSNIDLNDKEEEILESVKSQQETDALPSSEEAPAVEVAKKFIHPEENPEQLVQQGLSFLSGLARTLSSPEATQQLVDSLTYFPIINVEKLHCFIIMPAHGDTRTLKG